MRQFQAMSKGTEARDFNLIQGNASYVQTWSLAQIIVVVVCTIVQVETTCCFNEVSKYTFFRSILSRICSKIQETRRTEEEEGSRWGLEYALIMSFGLVWAVLETILQHLLTVIYKLSVKEICYSDWGNNNSNKRHVRNILISLLQ